MTDDEKDNEHVKLAANWLNMRAEIGVSIVTTTMPTTIATLSGGSRKSQAETPAARAATSSWVRDSRTKVKTPPRRIANGSIFWPRSGNCNIAMPIMTGVPTLCPAVRLSRSTMSIEKASTRKAA